jgi:hypothetical protein
MSASLFGWGREHGRFAHVMIQAGIQLALWSLVFTIVSRPGGITYKLFMQDFPVLLFGSVVLVLLGLRIRRPSRVPDFLSGRLVPVIAIAVLAIAAAGTWLVFRDFALTRDEIMGNFDAAFLASGRLIGAPPAEWLPYLDALSPKFMLDVPRDAGWMSSYLPGNAALRAIGERTIGMEWVNPVLAALSILALVAVARRILPGDRTAAVVAALLAASSAQFLAMAMTPYAMTAHLAFNLFWLWGFTRNDRLGDAGAIAAGFVATGLHQLIFHPLFVAPFIVHLWLRKERGRALVYGLSYAAIGLFWVSYWQLVLSGAGVENSAASATGASFLAARIAALLGHISIDAPLTMGFNLLRFIAWQNPLLLPLAIMSWPAIRRDEGIARPLAAGIILTILAMLVLLPWQGLGWGYRYLHGLIGSFCLLAAYGWRGIDELEGRRFVLAATTAVALLLFLPLQLKLAHDYAAPRARAFAKATGTDADIVLVVPAEDLFDDLVRNSPDLSNRPKTMDLRKLSPGQIDQLCRSYAIAFFDIRHSASIGFPQAVTAGEIAKYSARPEQVGCARPLPL